MAMTTTKTGYHHGHLAESLLDAVDEIASQFGIEAVTLRACAKRLGVSPASAFPTPMAAAAPATSPSCSAT